MFFVAKVRILLEIWERKGDGRFERLADMRWLLCVQAHFLTRGGGFCWCVPANSTRAHFFLSDRPNPKMIGQYGPVEMRDWVKWFTVSQIQKGLMTLDFNILFLSVLSS